MGRGTAQKRFDAVFGNRRGLPEKQLREPFPAFQLNSDGDKVWLDNGKLHREDGPAIERADGSKEWYLKDRLHREDGPAIERPDGTKECWENGKLRFRDD